MTSMLLKLFFYVSKLNSPCYIFLLTVSSLSNPQTAAISSSADMSSGAANSGYLRLIIVNIITPADQISIAVDCLGILNKTSGARNPRVPHRATRGRGLVPLF
eukprot:TRINITY_DN829_c0_g1_i9.p1 TRINITY_DN829_c0_g1~~TRINITY_DN829_c0_g1_i9.p1  ORF type:complete len:103 (+),score=7.57 TRINITY_DN829_c0_g1_i9:250-558(+)